MTVRIVESDKQTTGRLTLDQRLKWHACLQATINILTWVFPFASIVAAVGFSWSIVGKHPLPFIAIAPLLICPHLENLLKRFRWGNITRLVQFNDITAVAPLLDLAADACFHNNGRPKKLEPESGKLVLDHLPNLLDRMSAGDGPRLSKQQQLTLSRLTKSPKYYDLFQSASLRKKIAALLRD